MGKILYYSTYIRTGRNSLVEDGVEFSTLLQLLVISTSKTLNNLKKMD